MVESTLVQKAWAEVKQYKEAGLALFVFSWLVKEVLIPIGQLLWAALIA